MTTPQDTQPPPAPGQLPDEAVMAADLAAKQAAAQQTQAQTVGGLTDSAPMTGADVDALIRQFQQQMAQQQAYFDQRMTALIAQSGPAGPHPLVATADQLIYHLTDGAHRDSHAPAVQLADDLKDAALNAAESGDTSHVAAIIQRLERWLRRNPVPPGDAHHHRQAADIISFHLPDQLDVFVARPKSPGIESSQPPAKVISGSVTG